MHPKGEEVSETNAVADVERLKRQAERWESRARLASAASHSRAVIDQADNDALRAELAELRVKWEQECANLEMAERRVEAAEAEVERLTRECLDREATETDARERLRQAEERLDKVKAMHRLASDGQHCFTCVMPWHWPCPTASELQ